MLPAFLSTPLVVQGALISIAPTATRCLLSFARSGSELVPARSVTYLYQVTLTATICTLGLQINCNPSKVREIIELVTQYVLYMLGQRELFEVLISVAVRTVSSQLEHMLTPSQCSLHS